MLWANGEPQAVKLMTIARIISNDAHFSRFMQNSFLSSLNGIPLCPPQIAVDNTLPHTS